MGTKIRTSNMKLSHLVPYLVNRERLPELFRVEHLNRESETLLIYMEDTLNIESEIRLFDIDVTDDDLVFHQDGVRYVQLFPLDYAADLINSDLNLKNKGYSNAEIAGRLLEFAEKDA